MKIEGMYFTLGNCKKHGQKQAFATPPRSKFAVCVRCCSEYFIGHHLRELAREVRRASNRTEPVPPQR